ncbi:hypothetical protein DSO57_1029160 [Entomophthora muscae]|uniref:Uncharacterized protein n=1 Tax=Entomophthora muscae TaxID=34485 RepID=A0ACC2RFX4_9FUNG|nr:hypothetical protein DSO57_1029160 [Entomophthora muscae]
MDTTLELLSYSCAGSRQSMVLVGNLVLSGSKVVYHQRLHHMPKYIEWLFGVMCSVGGKTPEEYAQQESLLWGCILLGLAFPYSIGVNCVNFLPVNDSPFLPSAFCWLPNVWIIYTVTAKVLIQLHLGLEAIDNNPWTIFIRGLCLITWSLAHVLHMDSSDQLASFQILESVAVYSHFLDYLDRTLP